MPDGRFGAAEGFACDARHAVRLMHARHDRARSATAPETQAPSKKEIGWASRAYLPLHRLTEASVKAISTLRTRSNGADSRRTADERPDSQRENNRTDALEGNGGKRKLSEECSVPQQGGTSRRRPNCGMLHGDFVRSPHGPMQGCENRSTRRGVKVPGVCWCHPAGVKPST